MRAMPRAPELLPQSRADTCGMQRMPVRRLPQVAVAQRDARPGRRHAVRFDLVCASRDKMEGSFDPTPTPTPMNPPSSKPPPPPEKSASGATLSPVSSEVTKVHRAHRKLRSLECS